MILSRVIVNDGEEPRWKLQNISIKQFNIITQKRNITVLNAHEISLEFIIEAIREKLGEK